MGAQGRYQLLALALGALALASLVRAPGETESAAAPVLPVKASAAAASRVARAAPVASGQAALVIDPALLDVFHFYLLEQAGPVRADALRQHLRQTLAPGAYQDAVVLVDRYLAYMTAHDALLSAHQLSPNDMRRFAVWLEQRDRLRQRILGAAVTQAWYRQEDAQLRRIVDEALPPDELLTRIALDKAMTSFAGLARDAPAWRLRFDRYLEAKGRILHDPGLDESERSIQVRELLLRAFPSEAERFRARSLETD